MMIYSIFIVVFVLIYDLNIIFAEYSIAATQVKVKPRLTNAFPLIDSNCFCSYDQIRNLLLCSPTLRNSSSFSFSSTNELLINITLNDCTFSNNHLSLPLIKGKMIDQLRLYDINHQDYLVLDGTSLFSYRINHIFISYTFLEPITMLLMSNETFSSPEIRFSLRTLSINSCYLLTLNKPLNRLFTLESIILKNLQEFSWYDFQQQIIYLPKLHYISIDEDNFLPTRNIFNVLSCQDISTQWILNYRLIQTCSCKLITFLKTMSHYENNSIHIINNICQNNGIEYQIEENQTNLFCNKCLSYQCSNGTLCTETFESKERCLSLSRSDYETIHRRIPLTSYTKQYLFQESQQFLTINPNKTLEPSAFNSVATILIISNQNNNTENSPNDAQMFHQTFSEMLNRPWSPAIYSPSSSSPMIWQQLLISLDDTIININDNETKFEFQSQSLSTSSLLFPNERPSQDIFGWEITDNNIIIDNITTGDSQILSNNNNNITSRVFLKFNNNQPYKSNCNNNNNNNNNSNIKTNCTNRFSITSLKSQKLFYNTDRIPEYDVISIIAPNNQQRVTFYFEKKLSFNTTTTSTFNSSSSSNSFYDQLDLMISEGICMYLNTTSMTWQTDGCITDRQLSNNLSVTCTCEHLTMFTVFFSLTCDTSLNILEILSWIGCCLSIIGLSITLVMFIIIRQCRQTKDFHNGISSSNSSSSQELRRRIMNKPRRLSMVKSMLFVLCILLIIMNILIFILTFINSGRNIACIVFSASLYYFTLTAFLWKLLFAFQQSLFITNIFQPYWSDRTLFIIYLILTFLLPICPLFVMFFKYENFTFLSSTCNYCWLTREFLLYGLIIPILVIICLNIILYLYTMIHLCRRNRQQPGLRSTKSNYSRYMQNSKIGLFFAITMGLSWILGFLLLIPNSSIQLFGNILFCIVNTLQGFAFSIMVFCMLERKSFRKCCCFWKYKNSIKTTIHLPNIIPHPQPHPPSSSTRSNDDNNMHIKTIYNSSIYTTSTTSGGNDNINHKKDLSIEKEANEEEHIYSTPTF